MLRGLLQIKVGQAVVDHVNRCSCKHQLAALPDHFAGVGNVRFNAVLFEQLAKQLEFGCQVLRDRRAVDNQHIAPGLVALLQPPLIGKHLENALLERVAPCLRRQGPVQLVAARFLRACQCHVEQQPASVGVDFNQLRATLTEVKVVAHAGALRPPGVSGNGVVLTQRQALVAGQICYTLNSFNHLLYMLFNRI
ncbi:hypothetical protein GALL_463840 [mine drainage metagenome]|uniref:Uncharacterized protein n=1 Tax=mine drainage metagenome TaxID=410659 RepID=A0A1J5Q3F5_9ZZZZ